MKFTEIQDFLWKYEAIEVKYQKEDEHVYENVECMFCNIHLTFANLKNARGVVMIEHRNASTFISTNDEVWNDVSEEKIIDLLQRIIEKAAI